MKKSLLRTVLRKEVVGLARITVIILAVFLFLLEFGFRSDGSTAQLLDQLSYGLVIAAAFVTLGSLLRTSLRQQHIRKAELIWFFAALLLIFIKPAGMAVWHHAYHWPNLVFLLGFIFIELSRLELGRNSTLFNPALLFTTSFVLIIAVGTALFLLPKAGTRQITLIEALFTSTSAVCVTGLSVIDVSKDLTFAGPCVLLFLIQIGGLGVMTFTSFFAFFFKGRTSLEEQLRIRDIANTSLVNARSFITQVILFTIGVEIIGTGFIYYSVPSTAFVDTGDRLFFAVFHAISAFNNAGFSTLSAGMYDPILRYNYALMWIIGLMLIFGGLGFGIIFNFSKYVRLWIRERIKRFFTGTPCQRHPRLVNLGSRMALQVTVILIAVGTMAVMVFEWNGALVEHQTWWGRISTALYEDLTTTAAGVAARGARMANRCHALFWRFSGPGRLLPSPVMTTTTQPPADRTALICGIGGQDGAYLAKHLLDLGYTVVGSSRDAQAGRFTGLERLGIRDRVTLVSMSQVDFRSTFQVIKRSSPDEIYNLAGQSSVGLSFDQPVETFESIVVGTINLLEAIRMLGAPIRLYSAGSSEMFGNAGDEAANERTVLRPRSPYGIAKATSFWQISQYREAYGLSAATGILFNHESPLRPERFVTQKIVAAACRIARGEQQTVSLGDLSVHRDWGWAPEYVVAMHRMLQLDTLEDFVIATGQTHSLEEFVAAAFSAVGLDWRRHVVRDPKLVRPTEIDRGRADTSRATERLDWTARHAMPDVVRMMVESRLAEQPATRRAA
jgi:GDPmannose 4,6-dehydratase